MPEVPVSLELLDEHGGVHAEDASCDINPAPGRKLLRFRIRVSDDRLSGEIEGVHNEPAHAFESAGMVPDPRRAIIRWFCDNQ